MIELRHIRYFVAVAEELHFSRAARRLHIAQPPLSQQIRRLEDELDVVLFERNKRRVRLTPAGEVFLKQVLPILKEVARAGDLARLAHRENRPLKVGFVSTAPYTVFPTLLRAFRKSFPQIPLELSQRSIHAQLQELRDGTLDVGVLRAPVVDPHIRTEVLLKEPFVIALPDSHPLTTCSRLDPSQLSDQDFIMVRTSKETFSDVILKYCAKYGFSPHVVQEASEMDTILGLVSAGIGIAFVPQSAQWMKVPGVQFRALKRVAPTTELLLAWVDNPHASPVDDLVSLAKRAPISLSIPAI